MSDTAFHFIFSQTRHVAKGSVCRDITLNLVVINQILAKLAVDPEIKGFLVDPSAQDGLKDELTEFLLLPETDLSADSCFQACITVLLLALKLDKTQELMEHAGVIVWFDREEDTPLDSPTKMYIQAYNAEQVAEVGAAMSELGAEHRDLADEAINTALLTERQAATLH